MHGRGLNSIRWRFALASAALTLIGISVREIAIGHDLHFDGQDLATLLALVLVISTITFDDVASTIVTAVSTSLVSTSLGSIRDASIGGGGGDAGRFGRRTGPITLEICDNIDPS